MRSWAALEEEKEIAPPPSTKRIIRPWWVDEEDAEPSDRSPTFREVALSMRPRPLAKARR